jgi:tRNA 2-thiouridine synthesizing protein A
MGCGDLVLELLARIRRLHSGQVLKLVARDPGAAADVPAWCRLTGNTLIAEQHPIYFIRRKEP